MNGENEQDELNGIIAATAFDLEREVTGRNSCEAPTMEGKAEEVETEHEYRQWSSHDKRMFRPASKSYPVLSPGFYEICHTNSIGVYFQLLDTSSESLIRFKDINIDKVICDIEKFWTREKVFRDFSLTFKRGILLWGPQGTGKTCTVRLVMEDVIRRGGVVIKFDHPKIFSLGMVIFRSIQPKTPCVVLLEDIDAIISHYSESDVINILDGVERIDNTVFIATTNYPERLGARIVNRPSRFDRRYKIGNLNEESRKVYFNHLMSITPELLKKHDVDKWARDTDGFSISHLKELFVSVVILDDPYDSSLAVLKKMRDNLSTSGDAKLGFGK